ncbi:alpha-2-macroglobulin receptor-associated protein [Contarinia nasturtii]|uniref:alpha-2-macroglobulin receptor-associated protein n=1 Tax=Contarinia nasturtii TaxID=265458 RepID=UPI0012D4BA67|nr:alpha-2-macroglobulin receptor-associated protein [Contarinia nasturtii]
MQLNAKLLLISLSVVGIVRATEELSASTDDDTEIFRNLVRPFRMEKLNLIWVKAQQRLTEPKLQSLYTQMKTQDKEEIQYKQNSKDNDKDGSQAAKLRKKLIGIMRAYNLLEYGDHDKNIKPGKYDKHYDNNKVSTFKDKKLNKLWNKAEMAGFTVDELNELKKEFSHYDEKVEMYYKLLDNIDETIKKRYENTVNQDELDFFNEVVEEEVKDDHREYVDNANKLRDKHRDLKDTYDRLEQKTAQGRNRDQFIDPKVIHLWNTALQSNFTASELAALKEELFHFETKLLKLSHLYAEQALGNEKLKNKKDKKATEKNDHMEKNIKKHARKVEKLQESIEKQVYRHSEL